MNNKSRHLIDPELLAFLDQWQSVPSDAQMVQALRRKPANPVPACYTQVEAEVRVSTRSVRRGAGTPNLGVRVYRPARLQGPVGAVLHIHGGGYVCGKAADEEPTHRRWTAALGCVVVSVDYRLAPETTFPGNIEDCYAALAWLYESAPELHIDLNRIGVMGESAGGGLAAALALLARDRGEYKLAFEHLIYPMLDDRTCVVREPHPFAGEYIWTPAHNWMGWSALLGAQPGSKGISPYAAAARAENLAGLPPTFIATAALDLFVEENLEYARRLLRAGVAVELHVYPGGFHGFDLEPRARVAQAAQRDSLTALARALETRTEAGEMANTVVDKPPLD
jgi:acetyl esterase/lipase